MIAVGERIRVERIKQGMNQAKLAKKGGVSQADVSFVERGKNVNHPRIKAATPKLLKALGMEGIRERSKILSIPEGARRAEMGPCSHCDGSGQTWKFFDQ